MARCHFYDRERVEPSVVMSSWPENHRGTFLLYHNVRAIPRSANQSLSESTLTARQWCGTYYCRYESFEHL